jgi:hypothetical protein
LPLHFGEVFITIAGEQILPEIGTDEWFCDVRPDIEKLFLF